MPVPNPTTGIVAMTIFCFLVIGIAVWAIGSHIKETIRNKRSKANGFITNKKKTL